MARRITKTSSDVPYLTEKRIEEEAALVIAQYSEKHGVVSAPPIPVDDILEVHLKLTYELADLVTQFGHDDILGAIWFDERIVRVDQRLDPANFPSKKGRYHFTLAHETGHWCLHRHLYRKDPAQEQMFDSGKPSFVCRSSQKPRVELQADMFSGCLLMPRDLIKTEWMAQRGGLDPIVLEDLRAKESQIVTSELLRRGGLAMSRKNIDNALFEHCARPMAERFQVSPEAMRIRLEKLGYLLREKPLF